MGKLKDSREDGAISIGSFESTVELFKWAHYEAIQFAIDVKNEITPWRGYLNSPVSTSYISCLIFKYTPILSKPLVTFI